MRDILDEFLHIALVFREDVIGVTVVVDILDSLEHLWDGTNGFHFNFIYSRRA